ncbi:hypothetical protein GR184_11435 [Bacillus sp. BGMRC0062]|nr:hypothetical protein [Bacillus sp. BGMRC0062]
MPTANPWVLVGVATVAPIVTALVALLRTLLASTARKRKNVLANLEFIERLRGYENDLGVVLSPDVHDRARADLAHSTRLFVDRNSWQWTLAFPLVYGAFINVFAYCVIFALKVCFYLGLMEQEKEVLDSLGVVITVFSLAVIAWTVLFGTWLAVVSTRDEVVNIFKDRDNHLAPRPGPGLARPVGKPIPSRRRTRDVRAMRRKREKWEKKSD